MHATDVCNVYVNIGGGYALILHGDIVKYLTNIPPEHTNKKRHNTYYAFVCLQTVILPYSRSI